MYYSKFLIRYDLTYFLVILIKGKTAYKVFVPIFHMPNGAHSN